MAVELIPPSKYPIISSPIPTKKLSVTLFLSRSYCIVGFFFLKYSAYANSKHLKLTFLLSQLSTSFKIPVPRFLSSAEFKSR